MISCTVIFVFAPEQIPIKLEDDIEMQMMSPEDQITFLEKCMGEVQTHLPDTLIEYTGMIKTYGSTLMLFIYRVSIFIY